MACLACGPQFEYGMRCPALVRGESLIHSCRSIWLYIQTLSPNSTASRHHLIRHTRPTVPLFGVFGASTARAAQREGDSTMWIVSTTLSTRAHTHTRSMRLNSHAGHRQGSLADTYTTDLTPHQTPFLECCSNPFKFYNKVPLKYPHRAFVRPNTHSRRGRERRSSPSTHWPKLKVP